LKLVSYSTDGGAPHIGYVEDGEVHPLGGSSMLDYIEHGRSAERQPGGQTVPLSEARLHAPIARPGKIIGIGLNYEDHANETGGDRPEKPIVCAEYRTPHRPRRGYPHSAGD
jgi:2,4-didehydro-3-deoxy-L-rhamnonate hydrolase